MMLNRRAFLAAAGAAGGGIGLAGVLGTAAPADASPTPPSWYNVLDYGASRIPLEQAPPYNPGLAPSTLPAPPDSTAAFGAACAAADQAGGGIVYVPAGYYVGRFSARSRVIVQGDGPSTWVKAPPVALNPSNLPIWGNTDDAFNTGIRDIVLEGNRVRDALGLASPPGAAERGIWIDSPGGEHNSTPPGVDGGVVGFPPISWLLIDNVMIRDTAGDGCWVGINYRGSRVQCLEVSGAGGNGLVIACTDSHFIDCSVSGSYGLANVVCTGAFNQLTNVRSALTGDGATGVKDAGGVFSCGFLIYGYGWQLENCRSENHAGPAVTIGAPLPTGYTDFIDGDTGILKCRGLLCAGNAGGIYIRNGYGNHDIDAVFTGGDVGLLSPYGVSLMGKATVNPIHLRLGVDWEVDASATPGVDHSSWSFLVDAGPDPSSPGNGPPDLNAVSLEVLGAERARVLSLASGDTLAPDILLGLDHVVTLTGDASVGPLVHRGGCLAGAVVSFVVQQDSTGGHSLTWDASWHAAPQPAGAPGSTTTVAFVNLGSDPAQPSWHVWAPPRP